MQLADYPGLVFLIMAVTLPLAAELGYRLSQRNEARERAGEVSSATLGFLGLMIAFTFVMAAERFDTRRTLVVDEANAIGTTYLRYQLLDEPYRSRLGADMAPYVTARLAFAQVGVDPARLARNQAETARTQGQIWTELSGALRTPVGKGLAMPLLTATNEMFDLASSRDAAVEARVPRGVRVAVMIFALIAAMSIGWTLSADWRRRPLGALALLALVAFSLGVIADLDQPGAGFVRIPQGPMERAAQPILTAHPAATPSMPRNTPP